MVKPYSASHHLTILCGIHVVHRFNRCCIYTMWGELSSKCGGSCLLNVGRVVLEQVVLFPPLSYSKNGVKRVLHFFLIFALKHSLWVRLDFRICPPLVTLHNGMNLIMLFPLK